MSPNAKIATCCYCGNRAALVLSGGSRHELTCSTCGAPLHALKSLPLVAQVRPQPESAAHAPSPVSIQQSKRRAKSSRNKRKSVAHRFMSRAFDEALDALDDLFD